MSYEVSSSLLPLVVKSSDTVGDALRAIRRNGRGIVVVVETDDRVLGTVTDANIRRLSVSGVAVDRPVKCVMSRTPVVARLDADDHEIKRLQRTFRLRSIPILDGPLGEGRLVDVRTSDQPDDGCGRVEALVMAGGRGERLRPFTDKVPKPLLRVGSMSIVERIISSLARAGVASVLLAVNYKADLIEERLGSGDGLGVNVSYIREATPLGTAGALALLPQSPRGSVLVTNADIVTTLDFRALLDFHWHNRAAITVAAIPYLSRIPYGVLRTADHHLLAIEEKAERRDLCSAGIYMLAPEVLDLVPRDVAWDMPDVIADVLADGMSVQVFPILEKWLDVGGTAEFERILLQFAVGEDGDDDEAPSGSDT